MNTTFPFFLIAIVATLAVSGCKEQHSSNVLATVNGKDITQPEFDAYLDFKRIPAKEDKRRDTALDEYLEREALARAIEESKVLDADAIRAELDEFRKEMLISRYFDEFLREKVTDEAVKNYYETHAAEYEESKAKVGHILFRTSPRMSEEERKARLTAAQEAHAKLQTGADFAGLAKEVSDDKISGSRGGDLGWIKEGTIDARFSQRAFSTKPGTFTEPFETSFGFHIVRVEEAPKKIRRPLSAVAGDIRYQLRNEAKDAELKRLTEIGKITKKAAYRLDEKREAQRAEKQRVRSGPEMAVRAQQPDPGLAGRTTPPGFPSAPAVPLIPEADAVLPAAGGSAQPNDQGAARSNGAAESKGAADSKKAGAARLKKAKGVPAAPKPAPAPDAPAAPPVP